MNSVEADTQLYLCLIGKWADTLCCQRSLDMAFTMACLDDALTVITYDGPRGGSVAWNLETGEVRTLL